MIMRIAYAVSVAVLAVAACAAAADVVPADVQLQIVQNVVKLDRNFDARRGVSVGIVYQRGFPESVGVKDGLYAALAASNVPAQMIEADRLDSLRRRLADTSATVIYVAPLRAIAVSEITAVTRQRSIRTVTAVPEYVDLGVAVGISLRKKRPLILINLEAARSEGSAFSSQLLALSEIIGPLR